MAMQRPRLQFAAVVFLAEMRRQWAKQNPGVPCPVKSLEKYSEDQRSALMAAIERAIESSKPEADQTFISWTVGKAGAK